MVLAGHIALRAEIVAASARSLLLQAKLESLMNEYDRATLELAGRPRWTGLMELPELLSGMTEPVQMAVVLVDAAVAPAVPARAAVESARADRAPVVLAGLAGIVQQLVAAAVSNLVAGWFASPPSSRLFSDDVRAFHLVNGAGVVTFGTDASEGS